MRTCRCVYRRNLYIGVHMYIGVHVCVHTHTHHAHYVTHTGT
jgi:hypothetical protein